VLSDPDKRQKYDRFGAQWQQFAQQGGRPEDFDWGRWSSQPGGRTYTRTVGPEEFEQMFGGGGMGGFSDFFEALFGGMGRTAGFGTRRGPDVEVRARRGHDLEHTVQVTLDEAFHGATRGSSGGRGTIEAKIPRGVRKARECGSAARGAAGTAARQKRRPVPNVEVLRTPFFQRDGDACTTGSWTCTRRCSRDEQCLDDRSQRRSQDPTETQKRQSLRAERAGDAQAATARPARRPVVTVVSGCARPDRSGKSLFRQIRDLRKRRRPSEHGSAAFRVQREQGRCAALFIHSEVTEHVPDRRRQSRRQGSTVVTVCL